MFDWQNILVVAVVAFAASVLLRRCYLVLRTFFECEATGNRAGSASCPGCASGCSLESLQDKQKQLHTSHDSPLVGKS